MEEYGTQLDLFDLMYDYHKFDKDRPVRLIETFAGIGTQKMAFDRLGIDVDVVAIVEVDKFAMLSYASIHTDYLELRPTYFDTHEHTHQEMVDYLQDRNIGINFTNMKQSITIRNNIEIVRDYYLACILTNNLGDISKVKGSDLPKGIDVLTYSFPCTDLSKAGKQKGLNDTRSGLVYQVFRIVEELKAINNQPKTLLMENVVDLIQKKFINEFHEMQLEVESYGYMNYTMRLNAKDFGVAQNRDRVFMLSIPRNHNYTEPKPFKLEKKLKDYLEDDVDESFYMTDVFVSGMNNDGTGKYPRGERFRQCVKTADEWDISTTITTREGNVATSTFISDIPICLNPKVNGKQPSLQDRVYSEDGTMPAITTSFHPSIKEKNRTRIRKLTPLECWRLMGIDDECFHKAQQVTSDSQLYKQAGNAIVVDVFANIIKSLV